MCSPYYPPIFYSISVTHPLLFSFFYSVVHRKCIFGQHNYRMISFIWKYCVIFRIFVIKIITYVIKLFIFTISFFIMQSSLCKLTSTVIRLILLSEFGSQVDMVYQCWGPRIQQRHTVRCIFDHTTRFSMKKCVGLPHITSWRVMRNGGHNIFLVGPPSGSPRRSVLKPLRNLLFNGVSLVCCLRTLIILLQTVSNDYREGKNYGWRVSSWHVCPHSFE